MHDAIKRAELLREGIGCDERGEKGGAVAVSGDGTADQSADRGEGSVGGQNIAGERLDRINVEDKECRISET